MFLVVCFLGLPVRVHLGSTMTSLLVSLFILGSYYQDLVQVRASKVVVSVDVGTESCRAAVFAGDGKKVGQHAVPHATSHPEAGWAEQAPEDWWQGLGEAVKGAVAASGVASTEVAGNTVHFFSL